MMPAQQGTSLFELLISMTLFLFLALIASRLVVTMHRQGARLQSTLTGSCAVFAALGILTRDIRSADHTTEAWVMTSGIPLWLVRGVHVQWYLKSDILIRRTGRYISSIPKWEQYTDSVILHNMHTFLLTPHQSEKKNIDFVTYTIATKHDTLSGSIYIQNKDIA